MTDDKVKGFMAANAALKNAGRAAGFNQATAKVAVNVAAQWAKRGIDLSAQSEFEK